MSIGIILAVIVTILRNRLMGSEVLEPDVKIVMKSGFIIVDKNGGCYVHGIDESEALFDGAFSEALLHVRSDVDKGPPRRHLKPQFFSIAFHRFTSATI
jgi:hypothetical protein